MKQIDLLIPFALPPAELAPDLLRAMKTPALAMLLARSAGAPPRRFDDFARALPHEVWLAEQFGLLAADGEHNSPQIAAAAMAGFGLVADAGVWFMLQPVHFHITRDHLVLTDARRLVLSEADSRSLFGAALASFAEAGMQLKYGDACHWFVRADPWAELLTATPDAACGHNIDIWMPRGAFERAWRKVQNEVQMEWHAGSINAAREAAGFKPVNTLWLWGGAAAGRLPGSPYTGLANLNGWLRALGPARQCTAAELQADLSPRTLAVADALLEAALGADWSEWLLRLHALEAEWFAPLLTGLQDGKFDQLRLITTHNTQLTEFTVTRAALRKFWRKPSLARLAA